MTFHGQDDGGGRMAAVGVDQQAGQGLVGAHVLFTARADAQVGGLAGRNLDQEAVLLVKVDQRDDVNTALRRFEQGVHQRMLGEVAGRAVGVGRQRLVAAERRIHDQHDGIGAVRP